MGNLGKSMLPSPTIRPRVPFRVYVFRASVRAHTTACAYVQPSTRARARTRVHTYTVRRLFYLCIPAHERSTSACRKGGEWGKREDVARRDVAGRYEVRCINRSGQCCYGNTTHSHVRATGWAERSERYASLPDSLVRV